MILTLLAVVIGMLVLHAIYTFFTTSAGAIEKEEEDC